MLLALVLTVLLSNVQAIATSPAEAAIANAEHLIAKSPNHFEYYNALALAHAQRALERCDARYYAQAEETLRKSFELAPDNFEGLKVETVILLGRHEFEKALEVAQPLNKRTPDDIAVYGYIADADMALGNYAAAEESAQWMLRLRAGNAAGLTHGAYLRDIYGDLDGAIDFLKMAYAATPQTELENRARILYAGGPRVPGTGRSR